MSGPLRIDKVVTSGVFSLDGQDFDVDNNVWLIGDDDEVLVVDAAHQAAPVVEAIGSRSLLGVVCTHGHNDHINAALEVASGARSTCTRKTGCCGTWCTPLRAEGPGRRPDLHRGRRRGAGAAHAGALPGAVCLYVPALEKLLSGDTLFCGGPGATGRSFSSFPTILDSIRTRLLALPETTEVLTGHGDSTSIGAEAKDYDAGWPAATEAEDPPVRSRTLRSWWTRISRYGAHQNPRRGRPGRGAHQLLPRPRRFRLGFSRPRHPTAAHTRP